MTSLRTRYRCTIQRCTEPIAIFMYHKFTVGTFLQYVMLQNARSYLQDFTLALTLDISYRCAVPVLPEEDHLFRYRGLFLKSGAEATYFLSCTLPFISSEFPEW